ncbi:hypothetical protein GALMADRAFT_915827 [Galerina marginata CBS 339.88]|uniref:Uncharacterized protein n=1 Tax=Galerina marginata (strain CBS 339.88) TaxID=685588 RepID=A0A067SHR6_GALM3|nr:hypothetical protein GALMADRAFT_915827 [Galerina marginata CBS 339.88]
MKMRLVSTGFSICNKYSSFILSLLAPSASSVSSPTFTSATVLMTAATYAHAQPSTIKLILIDDTLSLHSPKPQISARLILSHLLNKTRSKTRTTPHPQPQPGTNVHVHAPHRLRRLRDSSLRLRGRAHTRVRVPSRSFP